MKIVCVGSASQDLFFPTRDGLVVNTPQDIQSQKKLCFELGAKYHIKERFEELGGCAANVAGGMAKLGLKTSCLSAIGDDLIGRWIWRKLKILGIGREYLQKIKNCPSDLSVIVVDEKSGERVIFSNQRANKHLQIDPLPLKKAKLVFIGDLSGNWRKNLNIILKTTLRWKVPIAFNPRQQTIHEDVHEIRKAIGFCQIVFLNKDEALEIVSAGGKNKNVKKLNDELYLLDEIKKLGAGVVAVTDGRRGAWVTDGKKIIYAGAVGGRPRETTGAGDAFASGFLSAFVQGRELENCLKWGVANGGSSVRCVGAHAGLLGAKDMARVAASVRIKYIK